VVTADLGVAAYQHSTSLELRCDRYSSWDQTARFAYVTSLRVEENRHMHYVNQRHYCVGTEAASYKVLLLADNV
jgi:hypothetical protein